MTGFGVPHILQSRATESSVAGFTLENNIHHYNEGGITVIEIVLMSIFGNAMQWILTAPVVDPIGLPPMPMPIPLKRNGFLREIHLVACSAHPYGILGLFMGGIPGTRGPYPGAALFKGELARPPLIRKGSQDHHPGVRRHCHHDLCLHHHHR